MAEETIRRDHQLIEEIRHKVLACSMQCVVFEITLISGGRVSKGQGGTSSGSRTTKTDSNNTA